MARRHAMSRGASRRMFTHHGLRTHAKNIQKNRPVMRGGIRL